MTVYVYLCLDWGLVEWVESIPFFLNQPSFLFGLVGFNIVLCLVGGSGKNRMDNILKIEWIIFSHR